MKKLICILSAAAGISLAAAAGVPDGYFGTREGMVLRCERYSADGTKHWWTQTTTIDKLRPRDDGATEIDFTANVVSVDEKSPVKGPVSSTAVLYPDGTIEVSISQAAAIAARQRFSAFNFKATGGTSSMAPTLKPGDELEEIHAAVSWGGIKYTIDYTDRSIIRWETITVPAGTFDCIVVKEHKVEKAPLFKRDRITYTWYTLGIGLVRHDTYFLDGKQECSERLYSIE